MTGSARTAHVIISILQRDKATVCLQENVPSVALSQWD